MSKLIDDLFELQTLIRLGESATPEQRQQIETLRQAIPEPVAAHFLRQIANGRRGIVHVRNGVCGECHLRLPHALVHMLAQANELLVCESCGTFVTLAPDERSRVRATVLPRARRVARQLQPVAN